MSSLIDEDVVAIDRKLKAIDTEGIARKMGLMQRNNRKLSMENLLKSIIALSGSGTLRLERIASYAKLVLGTGYSKQAVNKRIKEGFDKFIIAVAAQLFSSDAGNGVRIPSGAFCGFKRVLLQDSTNISLPERYKNIFPGSSNQNGSKSSLKIQLVMDMLAGSIADFRLSGFTRNDQAAARDILEVAEPGDLVLRDLGYFVLSTFEKLIQRGIYFISRYSHTVLVYDPVTGDQLQLEKIVNENLTLDTHVLLGKSKLVPMRLIAIPLPVKVADERRRKAKLNRDKRLRPSRKRLHLMGWNIYVTNVEKDQWTPEQAQATYRLRWQIEIIFKAWKSHLKITELNTSSESLLKASIAAKLVFCIITHKIHQTLEMLAPDKRHVSIIRVANLLSHCATLFASIILRVDPEQLLTHLIENHVYYEKREDRYNMQKAINVLLLG